MKQQQECTEIVQRLCKHGAMVFFPDPLPVTEEKVGKPATEFVGAFMQNRTNQRHTLWEVRAYSPTYIVTKMYVKGMAVKTERHGSEEIADHWIEAM